jgi:hypothetical protein
MILLPGNSDEPIVLRSAPKSLMTMRYVHPAAEQKRVAMEKCEKYRAERVIGASTIPQSHGVTTKVTTVERIN